MRDYDDNKDKKYRRIKRNIETDKNIPYIEHVKKVMGEIYEVNDCPKRVDYEKAVLHIINAGKTNNQKYELKDIHSSVYKAINKLLQSGEMKNDGNNVYPNNKKYKRKVLIDELTKTAYMKYSKPLRASSNTLAFAFKKNTDVDKAINMLRDYIGESHCFCITTLNNISSESYEPKLETSANSESEKSDDASTEKVLIIMLHNYVSGKRLKKSVTDITSIVNEVYNKQNIVTPPVDPFRKARDEKRAAKRAEKKCQEAKKNGISPVKS